MATKHTENYQLNLWEPGDKFVRTEFNENTSKLDAAIKSEANARAAGDSGLSAAIQAAKSEAAAGLAQKPNIIAGTYTGNYNGNVDFSGYQSIDLGVKPKAVFVSGEHPTINFAMAVGALHVNQNSLYITDTGFVAGSYYNTSPSLNAMGTTYHYLAIV